MPALSYKEIIKSLGKAVGSPEVKDLLKKLGTDKAPKLTKDEEGEYELEVYFTLPKNGLNLIFELPDDEEPRKESEKLLTLNCVQFYGVSPLNDITHAFAGELPFGISFEDNQKEVHRKAGKPSDTDDEQRIDLWDETEPMFSVAYKKDGKVDMIAYEIEMLEDFSDEEEEDENYDGRH